MMRLSRLDLTRFGHFTDRSIDFGPAPSGGSDFHIIHGANEAGKTVLMEAYLRLIYGFPIRESYGFKHPLNTLQVGGVIEINGVATELVRVKRAANSLLDRHGDAIPETILHSCLGGIAQDDYRKLFCLDDATMEAGGEEIINSKGDFGRLLFAAAAGIGNLTGVLDQVAHRAEEFYRKGASKTTFAGLKRDLDAVTGEIRSMDVSASAYHGLKSALETAEKTEAGARAEKAQLERRKSQLAAIIAAHPIAAELRAAEDALDPIAHYPQTLDIDSEALVAMMTAQVRLEAERDHHLSAMAKAETARSALVLHPDIIGWRDEILALEEMRARMQGALADLPIREADRDAALAAMRAKLIDLGFDPGDDPTRFVLPEHQLRGLERRLPVLVEAEAALAAAIAEERKAQLALQDSASNVAKAEAGVTFGPEGTEVLTRFGAAQCVEDWRAARQRLDLAQATAAQRLRELAPGGMTIMALPNVTLTQRQIDALVAEMLKAEQQVTSLRDLCATAAAKLAKAQARLGVLTSAADLVTDDLATASRAERDRLWTRHRAALDAATADSFATALLRDDSTTALRQAQTREIADYHQTRIMVSEADVDHQAAKGRLAEATKTQATLAEVLTSHLAAHNLATDLNAADLADWLRRHDAAREAQNDLKMVEDLTDSTRQSGEALRNALAALPGFHAEDDLDTLFRLALVQADSLKAQLAVLQAARDAQIKDDAALVARQLASKDARATAEEAETLWHAEASAALPPDTVVTDLREALPGLRGLREINETLTGLDRQIAGMTRDRDAFIARIAPLARAMDSPAEERPLDICRRASDALAAAETAAEASVTLEAAYAAARDAHSTAVADLATQDRQISQLAQAFASDIPTGTLQDLRVAAAVGKQAIDLRATIARLITALTTRLATPERAAAEAALAVLPLQEAEAELATLSDETPGLTKAFEDAIGARNRAEMALSGVLGDADVARCVTQQRLIEVEMQEGALRYLEDRFAHMLAERAIRRYRDAHRGNMLVATEAAFRILTNGTYGSLSTQACGSSEALVATQTADNSAKQAREMSKGTRFQLYLALRAAAYEQVASGGTILPFFCDDIFETFDESRTTAACGLMRQIGQRGQAIYLTHHQHVVDIARKLCGGEVRVHDLASL